MIAGHNPKLAEEGDLTSNGATAQQWKGVLLVQTHAPAVPTSSYYMLLDTICRQRVYEIAPSRQNRRPVYSHSRDFKYSGLIHTWLARYTWLMPRLVRTYARTLRPNISTICSVEPLSVHTERTKEPNRRTRSHRTPSIRSQRRK